MDHGMDRTAGTAQFSSYLAGAVSSALSGSSCSDRKINEEAGAGKDGASGAVPADTVSEADWADTGTGKN